MMTKTSRGTCTAEYLRKGSYVNARWIFIGCIFAMLYINTAFLFGWVAVANMLRTQGAYSSGCGPDWQEGETCPYQEKKLAFLYFMAICAEQLPAWFVYGPFIDKAGPKLASLGATILQVIGNLLFAFSNDQTFKAYIPAIFCMIAGGVGIGIVVSMHVSNLWPNHSNIVSLSFVAVFIVGTSTPLVLNSIIIALGNSRNAYRAVLCTWAGINSLFIPIFFWLQPWTPFELGEAYILTRPLKLLRVRISDLDRAKGQEVCEDVPVSEPAELQKTASHQGLDEPEAGKVPDTVEEADRNQTPSPTPVLALPVTTPQEGGSRALSEGSQRGLGGHPFGVSGVRTPREGSHVDLGHEHGEQPERAGGDGNNKFLEPQEAGIQAEGIAEARDGEANVSEPVPKVFIDASITEPRRHTQLRSMSFWSQIRTFEFVGMLFYFTFNYQFPNFWLATLKTQLENKGDNGHYADLFNIVIWVPTPVAFGLTAWLMHYHGQGFTLAVCQTVCMAFLGMQLVPNVKVQILTMMFFGIRDFMTWGIVYAIVGRIFGYTHYGTIFGLLSVINGSVGLLNIPLNDWVVDSLDSRYWIITVAQIVLCVPLYGYCYVLWRRENLNVEENVIKSTHVEMLVPIAEV